MATFPGGIYNPTSPTSSNKLNDAGVIHADQHTNANLEITNERLCIINMFQ